MSRLRFGSATQRRLSLLHVWLLGLRTNMTCFPQNSSRIGPAKPLLYLAQARQKPRSEGLEPRWMANSNRASLPLHLLHRALRRLLIRTPAPELCAVAKAASREMIVLNFDDQLWREGLPFRGSIGAPAARAAGRAAGEARRFDQSLNF